MQYKSLADCNGGLKIPPDMISRGPLLSIDSKLWAQSGAVWELEGGEVILLLHTLYRAKVCCTRVWLISVEG